MTPRWLICQSNACHCHIDEVFISNSVTLIIIYFQQVITTDDFLQGCDQESTRWHSAQVATVSREEQLLLRRTHRDGCKSVDVLLHLCAYHSCQWAVLWCWVSVVVVAVRACHLRRLIGRSHRWSIFLSPTRRPQSVIFGRLTWICGQFSLCHCWVFEKQTLAGMDDMKTL